MALVPADAENAVSMEVGLTGLAERWESCLLVRQKARRNNSLLDWPCPKTVGVPSMILICKKGLVFGEYNIWIFQVQYMYIPYSLYLL